MNAEAATLAAGDGCEQRRPRLHLLPLWPVAAAGCAPAADGRTATRPSAVPAARQRRAGSAMRTWTTTIVCAASAAGRAIAGNTDLAAWDHEDVLALHARAVPGGREIVLLTDGMRCAACAWLIDRALAREAGSARSQRQRGHRAHPRGMGSAGSPAVSPSCSDCMALGYRPYLAGGAADDVQRRADTAALAAARGARGPGDTAGHDVRRSAVPGYHAPDASADARLLPLDHVPGRDTGGVLRRLAVPGRRVARTAQQPRWAWTR